MAVNVDVVVAAREVLVRAESHVMAVSAQGANPESQKKQKSLANQRIDKRTTAPVMDDVMNETRLAQRENHVRNSVLAQNVQTVSQNKNEEIVQQNDLPIFRRTNPQSRQAM